MPVRTFIFTNGFHSLAADSERSFVNLFISFSFFQCFSAIIFDRDFCPDLRFGLSFRSFIGIRRFKHLEFCLETLFPFNQLKQFFATVKFDLDPN